MPRILLHLDANCINAHRRIPELNELERLAKRKRKLELQYSETAYGEALHGVGWRVRERKLSNALWTGVELDSAEVAGWKSLVELAVFPLGAKSPAERNDVDILLAAKMAGAILVTSDGASRRQRRGILGSKVELAALGITVLQIGEALKYAKANLTRRPHH